MVVYTPLRAAGPFAGGCDGAGLFFLSRGICLGTFFLFG